MNLPTRSSGEGRRPFRTAERRAMTFLEILIVVVILGILITVTAARLKGTSQRSALLGAARELVGGFNVARQAAISTHRDVWVQFDVNKDCWSIDLNVDREEEDRRAHFDRDARYDLEMPHELPAKVSFTEVTTEDGAYVETERSGDKLPVVAFHPDGTSNGGYVRMENEQKRQMTVQVSMATGRVEAYTGSPRTFEEKLKSLGVNPSSFAPPDAPVADAEQTTPEGTNRSEDPNEERSARERQERQQYYQDVLNRILDQRRQVQQIQAPNPVRGQVPR